VKPRRLGKRRARGLATSSRLASADL
jgi:hypothetical protein